MHFEKYIIIWEVDTSLGGGETHKGPTPLFISNQGYKRSHLVSLGIAPKTAPQ